MPYSIIHTPPSPEPEVSPLGVPSVSCVHPSVMAVMFAMGTLVDEVSFQRSWLQ